MLGPIFNGPSGFSRGLLSVLSIDDGDGDNSFLNPKEIDGRLEIGDNSTRLMTCSPLFMSAAVVAVLVWLIGKPAALLGLLLVSITLKCECETWSLSALFVLCCGDDKSSHF